MYGLLPRKSRETYNKFFVGVTYNVALIFLLKRSWSFFFFFFFFFFFELALVQSFNFQELVFMGATSILLSDCGARCKALIGLVKESVQGGCFHGSILPVLSMTARSANTDDGVHVDILTRGFWNMSEDAFYDIRVFFIQTHPSIIQQTPTGDMNRPRSRNMDSKLGKLSMAYSLLRSCSGDMERRQQTSITPLPSCDG